MKVKLRLQQILKEKKILLHIRDKMHYLKAQAIPNYILSEAPSYYKKQQLMKMVH